MVGQSARSLLLAMFGVALGLLSISSSASAQDDEYVTYRMEAGDTLYALEEDFLRGGNAVARVALLNRIYNPRRIPIGTVIRLPRELLDYEDAGLTVYSFSGPVTIGNQPAAQEMALRENAVVQTGAGGFVSFRAADGGTISLPSNTTARLERSRIYRLRNLRDVEFHILRGRGEVDAPTLRDDERWRTSTPVAVTAVRGTQYRVGYYEDSELGVTEVVEGTVAVASDDVSELTPEGFGISANPAGLGEQEELLPPAGIANLAGVQTGELVQFDLLPPEGAVATRTAIARDAGFLEIIAEDVGLDEASFADLEDGRYFVRSLAVSESGIVGLASPEDLNFRRRRLGSDASSEESPIADGFRFVWLPEGEGTVHFAFQLWRQGDTDNLLFDEIALPGTATVVTGLDEGTYVWRVAAVEASPDYGFLKVWGPERTFSVSGE